MARVVEGFHSFTSTPKRLSTNGMNHTCLCLPSQSWSSFTDPGRMEDWVGLGTTAVSKQSARDHYVTDITVVSCSNRYASLGNYGVQRLWASNPSPRAASRDANHCTTDSPSILLLVLKHRLQELTEVATTDRSNLAKAASIACSYTLQLVIIFYLSPYCRKGNRAPMCLGSLWAATPNRTLIRAVVSAQRRRATGRHNGVSCV